MYIIVFDRQHVKATQDAIFSMLSDAFKTSGSVSCKEIHVLKIHGPKHLLIDAVLCYARFLILILQLTATPSF